MIHWSHPFALAFHLGQPFSVFDAKQMLWKEKEECNILVQNIFYFTPLPLYLVSTDNNNNNKP